MVRPKFCSAKALFPGRIHKMISRFLIRLRAQAQFVKQSNFTGRNPAPFTYATINHGVFDVECLAA